MSSEFFAEAVKVGIGAIIGGLITAATALPYLNNRLTELHTEVTNMKDGCTTCKASVGKSLEKITDNINTHHADDERHNSGTSHALLADILARVMRIETRLFTGYSARKTDS